MEDKITPSIKNLVIARIETNVPQNFKLSIGNNFGISKEEMIEHVTKEDEIGKQIIASHLNFIRSVASGEFTKAISFEDNK